MPTKSVHDLLQDQIAADPAFAATLLREAVEALLGGDFDAGKAIICDFIKATAGFEKLGIAMGIPPKSLSRMFGPRGNPPARNLFGAIAYLQKVTGLRVQVVIEAGPAKEASPQPRKPVRRSPKPRKAGSSLSRRRAA
jgi:hypothetical protein